MIQRFFSNREVRIYTGITMATLLLNAAAWRSTALCDAYIVYVFPIFVNVMGRFAGLFPFSLGEWMLVAGAVLVIVAGSFGVAGAVLGLGKLWKWRRNIRGWDRQGQELLSDGKKEEQSGSNQGIWKGFGRLTKRFFRFFAWVVLWVFVVITLNSSMLYHGTPFAEKYMTAAAEEYSLEACIRIHNFVAEECNRLSGEMARDTEGKILYPEHKDIREEAVFSMQELGEIYDQLDGWYPEPKPMFFSDLMCQMYMCGYYFPFSMEANYNDAMYLMNKPATLCHELAHLRGFILEDEANFIAYLACVQSEDAVFRYSGYLSVLTYLRNDLIRASREDNEIYEQAVSQVAPVEILPRVREDNIFVEQEEWDRIHAGALLSTETVEEASNTLTDTLLKINGVSDGKISYSRVVELLLQYYAGHMPGEG